MTDLTSRADAIEAVKDTILKRFNLADWYEEMLNCGVEIEDRIKALPSAEAKPTVIRSKTLMPTKDFKEWAKRVREDNPNVIVIPCDAEVVSADAVQGEWKIDEYGIYHCPFCHAINNTVYKSFCPNCGARMKGGEE